ncbi:hypothetical protein [Halocatena pleomorpha]|uniref:Uncharacterized protein n=1 Tax=Halocatena pleomorpha TaxID=1785090 RepID=A0A3P3R946_9EURY|nr:hypothetical protein [Halocatena pleomorpha]RRJ29936.1 hypothetical protein EIK79_11305 [Halocatena pleomorpha]
MPQQSVTAGPPTDALAQAGELLQTLTPRTLATLLIVVDDDPQTQGEIAETIGSARSTVSKYLLSLEELPLPLVMKGRQRYAGTDAGRTVIGLFDGMTERLGVDLATIDWQTDTEVEQVADCLTPLCDSRSLTPIFVLEALRGRSGIVDLLGTPRPVSVEVVVDAVDRRHRERGEHSTTEQIRTILRRFKDADAIKFDGDDCILSEKGQEHACLLHRIVELLEEQAGRQDEREAQPRSGQSDDSPRTTEAHPSTAPIAGIDTGRIANQLDPRQFTGGGPPDNSVSTDEQKTPTIIPAYWLVPDTAGEKERTQTQPTAVLPLTSMTPEELVDRSTHLLEEHGTDAALVPYWTLQMGNEHHPLEKAELSLDAVNPWTLLTGARHPTDERSEDDQS